MNQIRLHIKLGDQRTTISADSMLTAMLAIKLGHEPETPEGNRAVREWLQERLPSKVGTDKGIGKRASQNAQRLIVEAIADTKISRAYDDWVVGQ